MNAIQKWLIKKEQELSTWKSHKERDMETAIIKLYVAKHVYKEPAIVSYDFNGDRFGIWMSHRGCARASDAVKYFPEAVRDHRLPKRIKAYELYNEKALPKELLATCRRYAKEIDF
jgi:hypothetical protein